MQFYNFTILKYCNISRKQIDHVLRILNSICYKTAELYANKLVNSDVDALRIDNRGRYHRYSIFEFFPDLREHLHEFVIDKVSQKISVFNIKMCIDEGNAYLKRSRPEFDYGEVINYKSIQNLLDNWGFKYSNNKSRPFINGHERADVVAVRQEFIQYFYSIKQSFFIYEKNGSEYSWKYPACSDDARIIVAHDESTIRSGKPVKCSFG